MMKRIQELAEQAGYAPLKPRTFADDLQDIFLQKFAELIVRECAEIVQEGRWMVQPTQEQLARSIRQHFGVE